MTPQQIDLVQTSFKKVVPNAGTAADLFHDRLFEISPPVRSQRRRRDDGGGLIIVFRTA